MVIDPVALDEQLDTDHESPVAEYGNLSRMVNRNDATVAAVLVNGECVVADGVPTDVLGTRRTGQFLRAQ